MTPGPVPEPPLASLLRAELWPAGSSEPVTLDGAPGGIVSIPDDEALVAALAGERRDRRDRIVVAGRRLDRLGPAGRVRRGLALIRGTEVAPDVTVLDHLAAAADLRRARELLDRAPLLSTRGGDPAGILSGGERRVLGWLLAHAVAPRVVLVDRGGTGLDSATLRWAHGRVDRWLDAGVAVLLRVGRIEEERWHTHRADGRPRPHPRGGRP